MLDSSLASVYPNPYLSTNYFSAIIVMNIGVIKAKKAASN
jgi:hypothetical protein